MKGEKMAKKNGNDGLRQRTHDRVDSVMDKAESIGQRGKDSMAHVKERARMMKGKIDGYIKNNPKKTVMYAAGAGAVAGAVTTSVLMRKRRMNQSKIDAEA